MFVSDRWMFILAVALLLGVWSGCSIQQEPNYDPEVFSDIGPGVYPGLDYYPYSTIPLEYYGSNRLNYYDDHRWEYNNRESTGYASESSSEPRDRISRSTDQLPTTQKAPQSSTDRSRMSQVRKRAVQEDEEKKEDEDEDQNSRRERLKKALKGRR